MFTPALAVESAQRILQKVLTAVGGCDIVRAFSSSSVFNERAHKGAPTLAHNSIGLHLVAAMDNQH
jgi:hypothetical protein